MDRASTFSDPAIVELLRTRFVPVALDVWYEERRQDAAGELFREVVLQREGMTLDRTTQGFYTFRPDGALLHGWNNRDPAKVLRFLREALEGPAAARAPVPAEAACDARFERAVPEGGLVLETYSRILEARYDAPPAGPWGEAMRTAMGRDHLWVLPDELVALARGRGELPPTFVRRLARFHLIDGTRGEPAMWSKDEVRVARLSAERQRDGRVRLRGRVELQGEGRGYEADLHGWLELTKGRLTRLDLLATGEAWGASQYTSAEVPAGRFRLAVAVRLPAEADREAAARVPPQGARDLRDYIGTR